MKKLIKFINEVIKLLSTFKTQIKDQQDTNEQEVVNIPTVEEQPKEPIENVPSEVVEVKPIETYKMLSIKEYQTQLKKIGLYTKGIDGIVGNGTKEAIRQFNVIFLNSNSTEYTEKTDRLLRVIYDSYCKSPYMKDSDWQYFKNFKFSEYKCKCGGKYCNGKPHELAIHIVMANQYVRNTYNKSVSITSGLRCQKWNDLQSGSTKNSQHRVGQASDSGINNVSASNLRATYKQLPFVYYSYDITSKYVHISVNL